MKQLIITVGIVLGLLCTAGLAAEKTTKDASQTIVAEKSKAPAAAKQTSTTGALTAEVVSVKRETIERYGAVSAQVAEEMAEGGKKLLAVDICISDTGIAGPGGTTDGKAVGLFYLGLAHGGRTYSRQHNFAGSRERNKQDAAEAALKWLKEYLLSLK